MFAHSEQDAWPPLRLAYELVESVARQSGGLIWDDATRLLYSPDAWHEVVLATKSDGIPSVNHHVTIHAYNKGEFVRAVTLGMSKFGVPDVVIEDFSWHSQRPIGNLINAFCQALIEGATCKCPGDFDLDLRNLKNDEIRDSNLENLKQGAEGIAKLTLQAGNRDEGDPENHLVEIQFGRNDGADVHARQERMLSALFGAEDTIVKIQHDAEIVAASDRARAKLPELRQAFNAGLAPGEFILVKAPFKTPDGAKEWMWVEIIKWSNGTIEGLLQNDPFEIPDLRAGQIVNVHEEEVFDFIHRFADKHEEGNETGKLIQQSQP
jgi:uncharacterized protein YegJ (DUF2314 family)